MTLHWWMHWFWVTAQLAGILASPLPSTTQDPRIQRIIDESTLNTSTFTKIDNITSTIDQRPFVNESSRNLVAKSLNQESDELESGISSASGPNFRFPKAINSHSTTKTNTEFSNNPNTRVNSEITEIPSTTSRIFLDSREITTKSSNRRNTRIRSNTMSNIQKREDPKNNDSTSDSIVRDSEITWLLTTSKTPERRKKINDNFTRKPDILRNFSVKSHEANGSKDLTVLPLRIESSRFKLVVNSTRTITSDGNDGFSTRTFNGSEDIEIDQELAEPRLSATSASILQAGISESTRLSRARNAFTSDFQRDHRNDEAEDRSSDIDVDQVIIETNESVNREIETSSSPTVIDIAAITGSCLATIVLLSTMASLGFVMYRRKYLNPPQTLNSDKCSNPDSSGYIDDSTIRDNSEEMYSLDNDSFLNSLEAMTIQNYWTDSVKHTKL